MDLTGDNDNSCTEPEIDAEPTCDPNGSGELLEAMLEQFSMWLDQGATPGFQCVGPTGQSQECNDPTEGDNVWQEYEGQPWKLSAEQDLSEVLSNAYDDGCTDDGEPLEEDVNLDGHDNYGFCHGLAEDGRMVGSTTYYLGLEWELPLETGNEVQTDSLSGDLSFEVEQHRNNPSPF